MHDEPYVWAMPGAPFRADVVRRLARQFPRHGYRVVDGSDGEKSWAYSAAPLSSMDGVVSERLPAVWRRAAAALAGAELSTTVGSMLGLSLAGACTEINAMVYPAGGNLGAHTDLADKLATLVLWFNPPNRLPSGGRFLVLRSGDASDVRQAIEPVAGNAALIRRSDRSWHAVEPVLPGSRWPRLTVTVTWYRAGACSTMWPPGIIGDLTLPEVAATARHRWQRG